MNKILYKGNAEIMHEKKTMPDNIFYSGLLFILIFIDFFIIWGVEL